MQKALPLARALEWKKFKNLPISPSRPSFLKMGWGGKEKEKGKQSKAS